MGRVNEKKQNDYADLVWWVSEPTALSGVFPLLPGSYLIGISYFPDPDGFGLECPLSLSLSSISAHRAGAGEGHVSLTQI